MPSGPDLCPPARVGSVCGSTAEGIRRSPSEFFVLAVEIGTGIAALYGVHRSSGKILYLLKASGRRGFTLLEVLVATALLGLLAGSAIWALTQANNYASIARLYTGAETAAQNQIDLILTEGPFNPQSAQVPIVLTLSPPSQVETDIILYSEPNGTNGPAHTIVGTRTTTVTKVPPVNGVELNLYTATVVVTYTYRSKNYRVQLNAMRASDI